MIIKLIMIDNCLEDFPNRVKLYLPLPIVKSHVGRTKLPTHAN